MIAFIDANSAEYGVAPICKKLPIAPSTYYAHKGREHAPELAPQRVQREWSLKPKIRRVVEESSQVFGIRKIWKQIKREGFGVARCMVLRLMRDMRLRPGAFVHTLCDAYLYHNHFDQARWQLSRAPYATPAMRLTPAVSDLFGTACGDFTLEGYQSHTAIMAPKAV